MCKPDLDGLYGPNKIAERVSDAEKLLRPESLTKLTDETAPLLKALMEAAANGLPLARGLFAHTPMLWVLDGSGEIFIALEEVVTNDTYRFLRPRSRRDNMHDERETRLGHPSLVGGDCMARLGGELSYDPGWGSQLEGWFISNASGRYGMQKGHADRHLRNVCDLFSNFGITVRPIFY